MARRFCRKGKVLERDSRTLGDIEQRMAAIGLIQQPEECHLRCRLLFVPADCPVKATPAELRLASPVDSLEGYIAIEHPDNIEQDLKAFFKGLFCHKSRVVCGRVVLWKGTVGGAHEAANR